MFGVASVEPDNDQLYSLLCNDANDVDDFDEREYVCKGVVTQGKRRCAFNRQTAMCESIQSLMEEQMVNAIKSGNGRTLIPAANFAEQQLMKSDPETNQRLNMIMQQLGTRPQIAFTSSGSGSLFSIHPLAQLGLMMLTYASKGFIFATLKDDPKWQNIMGLLGANAVRLLFDSLTANKDGSSITRVGTTLLKLFLPESVVNTLLMAANIGTLAGLVNYFQTK